MENNEVMVTEVEVMETPEVVESGSNGVIGIIIGTILGATVVGFGRFIKNKIKTVLANRKTAKEEPTEEVTEKVEEVEK